MLSVPGQHATEVFAALATDERLDADERAAAANLARRNDNEHFLCHGREWCSFVSGPFTFRVWPYTTGATVNVGVDRH